MRAEPNPKQVSVLIVSDDAAFSRALTGRWQSEVNLPAFTVVGSDICRGEMAENFDAVILGDVDESRLPAATKAVQASGKPVVLVCERGMNRTAQALRPRPLIIPRAEGWLDTVILLLAEVLRHREIASRVHRLEEEVAQLQRDATLGRYMLEMRHSLNNALTAVLGNAELLMLEPGTLSSSALAQVETVRNMSLRIHEIMQRFSSLEKELSVMERQAEKDGRGMAHAAGAN
jgi:signal transduction histidine kinase